MTAPGGPADTSPDIPADTPAGAPADTPADTSPDATRLPGPLARHAVVDAHVHVFPPGLFEAVWRWFDRYGWPIRYQLQAREVLRFLFDRGVQQVVGLHYAHRSGVAVALNRFAAELAREEPRLVACATVLPGEPSARAILDEALGPLGLRGVKIHCHVQCLAPDDPRLDDVYDAAAAHGVPVVIHAGNAPSSPQYGCDVEALCTPEALEHALARHPRTTVLVPHLGAARIEETAALLARHDRLYLDTTMVLNRFVPVGTTFGTHDAQRMLERGFAVVHRWPERVLYGTDFPHIPYEWDRELGVIAAQALPESVLVALLAGNAKRLFRITD